MQNFDYVCEMKKYFDFQMREISPTLYKLFLLGIKNKQVYFVLHSILRNFAPIIHYIYRVWLTIINISSSWPVEWAVGSGP